MTCPACGLATDNLTGHAVDTHKTPLEKLTEMTQPLATTAKVAQVVGDDQREDRTESGLSIVREDRGPYL